MSCAVRSKIIEKTDNDTSCLIQVELMLVRIVLCCIKCTLIQLSTELKDMNICSSATILQVPCYDKNFSLHLSLNEPVQSDHWLSLRWLTNKKKIYGLWSIVMVNSNIKPIFCLRVFLTVFWMTWSYISILVPTIFSRKSGFRIDSGQGNWINWAQILIQISIICNAWIVFDVIAHIYYSGMPFDFKCLNWKNLPWILDQILVVLVTVA